MKNKVYEGNSISFVAGAAITSGDGLCFGQLPCVATKSAAIGETVTAETTGVFTLSVQSVTVAINNGDRIYFNNAATPKFNNTVAGGIAYGIACDDSKAPGAVLLAIGETGVIPVRLLS